MLRANSLWLYATGFLAVSVLASREDCENRPPTGNAFQQLTDPCRYDKLSRPERDNRTIVYVHMHLYSVGAIDFQNLQLTAQLIIRLRWKDLRLSQNGYIELGTEVIDRIWIPHVYIVNEQESKVMGTYRKDVMNLIRPDGTIILCTRLKVTLQCVMNLQKFPFDRQYCPLIMESWSYNASQLELVWEEDEPVTRDINLQLSEYALDDILLNETYTQYGSVNYSSSTNEYFHIYYAKAGTFSTLTLNLALTRRFGYYIMDYYVPSIMIVVLSWVTFWLDANSTPGRTTLGTSTLLTFITLSRNLDNSLPKVSYIKASEIWCLGCTAFIFFSVAEFAFANIIYRRKKSVTLKKVTSIDILQSTLTPHIYRQHVKSLPNISSTMESHYSSLGEAVCLQNDITTISIPQADDQNEETTKSFLTMTPQEIANWIDRKSRMCFPLAFLIFNCAYWTWVLVF